MLIEYYATNEEDDKIFEWMEKLGIKYTEAFNPEDYYFVLETDDDRIITVMTLLGIEMYISAQGEKIVGGEAKL
jgi:ribosome assembly protein YihI (activator of Der GTPase)